MYIYISVGFATCLVSMFHVWLCFMQNVCGVFVRYVDVLATVIIFILTYIYMYNFLCIQYIHIYI